LAHRHQNLGLNPQSHGRVRPHDNRSGILLLRGIERSPTLRLIVDQLETRDVIVYIVMQPTLKPDIAGHLTWLTSAGGVRYVRISLNPTLANETLVSVLGHELQHALEVALAPAIVDETSLEDYYRHHGIQMRLHTSGWDTFAAREAGELVRREITDMPAVSRAESVARFDPAGWSVAYNRMRDRFTTR
jgi:hypothetical protein